MASIAGWRLERTGEFVAPSPSISTCCSSSPAPKLDVERAGQLHQSFLELFSLLCPQRMRRTKATRVSFNCVERSSPLDFVRVCSSCLVSPTCPAEILISHGTDLQCPPSIDEARRAEGGRQSVASISGTLRPLVRWPPQPTSSSPSAAPQPECAGSPGEKTIQLCMAAEGRDKIDEQRKKRRKM